MAAGEPGRATSRPSAAVAPPIALDEVEISILRSLAVQLLELVGPGEAPADADDDPLAALFAEGPSKPPDGPGAGPALPRRVRGDDERDASRVPPLHRERPAGPQARRRAGDGRDGLDRRRPGGVRADRRGVPAVARHAQRPAADHRHPAGRHRRRRATSCTGCRTTTRASRW